MRLTVWLAIVTGACAGVVAALAVVAYRVGDEPLLEAALWALILCLLLGSVIDHIDEFGDDGEDDWW